MKDNISIIFTAIIGTFLIVILPLYSILDRQDSMSYNVVLTETTKLVDNIRNNGFLDRQTYYDYISALSSTANTYKVTIEAYRKTLIHDTDEVGNIIEDSYVEEIELYNTKDILQVLEGEIQIDTEDSNKKNNVYLFEENDEIYVKVYNTNITAGSILYSAMVGPVNNKVIDISYGGVINDVNWELYDKIQQETVVVPQVDMSVPVNKNNNTNIVEINADGTVGDIDCTAVNLSFEEISICEDLSINGINDRYQYLYDLSKEENKTIKIAIELKGFDTIDIGLDEDNYISLSELYSSGKYTEEIANNIISKYIQLNGMYADKELKLREENDYYYFDLVLTNVASASLDYISSSASITILPGLGQNEDKISSLGADSVEIQLVSTVTVNKVRIEGPYNWKKLLKTGSLAGALISDGTIYVNQDIFFLVFYSGITGYSQEEIASEIEKNLKINNSQVAYSDLEIITTADWEEKYDVHLGRIAVKLKYDAPRNVRDNYIEILENWIKTNAEGVLANEPGYYANGGESTKYEIDVDDLGPEVPKLTITGTKGLNGWYTSEVTVGLIPSTTDRIYQTVETATSISRQPIIGGVGVERSTITLKGSNLKPESELTKRIILENEGYTYITTTAYDYLGNMSSNETTIAIDKTAPTKPGITVSGTIGNNGWYRSNVKINITPGTDTKSGADRTTYKITGANAIAESVGTSYTLTKEGKSTVTVTTYDKAGNKSQEVIEINIEKTEPKDATIKVISGNKNSEDNEWYISPVTLSITLNDDNSTSGIVNSTYEITGDTVVNETAITDKIKEITLTNDGIHTVTVYTRTNAGNVKETTYTVRIDKTAPNLPMYQIKGIVANQGWYTSDVTLTMTGGTDEKSGVDKTTYKITGANAIEETIGTTHTLTNEGKSTVVITTYDKAGNKSQKTLNVNIEKRLPSDAIVEVVQGEKSSENNEWYISPVTLRLTANSENSASGIMSITYEIPGGILPEETVISKEVKEITYSNNGEYNLKIYTTSNAGNITENSYTFKIDKALPSAPTINIEEQTTSTIIGANLYNTNITVNVLPGSDTMSGVNKTTYEVTSNGGQTIIIPETIGNKFVLSQEGNFTITAKTYDNAGNVSETSKAVSINKTKPEPPTIISINGTNVENIANVSINGGSELELGIGNVSIGNKIEIILLNESTYVEKKINIDATNNTLVNITLETKGSYKITVKQINMYGTTSDANTGYYRYIYE